MKLQYLGDYRDAFKWDLLHWLCTRSQSDFASLAFIPLLTPDDVVPRDGQIVHSRFAARSFIHDFVGNLRNHPEGFNAITHLGALDGQAQFSVIPYRPTSCVPDDGTRPSYWSEFEPAGHPNTVVFLDPDNGFETKTCRRSKWVLHADENTAMAAAYKGWALVSRQGRDPRCRDRSGRQRLYALSGHAPRRPSIIVVK